MPCKGHTAWARQMGRRGGRGGGRQGTLPSCLGTRHLPPDHAVRLALLGSGRHHPYLDTAFYVIPQCHTSGLAGRALCLPGAHLQGWSAVSQPELRVPCRAVVVLHSLTCLPEPHPPRLSPCSWPAAPGAWRTTAGPAGSRPSEGQRRPRTGRRGGGTRGGACDHRQWRCLRAWHVAAARHQRTS